jgi:hypothetical protein
MILYHDDNMKKVDEASPAVAQMLWKAPLPCTVTLHKQLTPYKLGHLHDFSYRLAFITGQ